MRKKLVLLCASVLFFVILGEAAAQTVMLGFETGDFTGWEVIGDASVVDSSYGTFPHTGDYQALLTPDGSVTLAQLESFLGVSHDEWVGWGLPADTVGASGIKTSAPMYFYSYADYTKFLTDANTDDQIQEGLGIGIVFTYDGDVRTGAGFRHTSDRQQGEFISSLTPFQKECKWGGGLRQEISQGHWTGIFAFVVLDIGPDIEGHGLLVDSITIQRGPTIANICSDRPAPKEIITIRGKRFGDTQEDSIVHIWPKAFDLNSPKIKRWNDNKIEIKIPNYKCEWFGQQGSKSRKVWVTVDGVDSEQKSLRVVKPDDCP